MGPVLPQEITRVPEDKPTVLGKVKFHNTLRNPALSSNHTLKQR